MYRPARYGQSFCQALVVAAILAAAAQVAQASQAPITIDGAFADWDTIAPVYEDAVGDGGAVDLGRVWLADDGRFLFIRLETGAQVDPSENNQLRLYVDADANSATGIPVFGIGAELEWRMGDRRGTFCYSAGCSQVFQSNIRFRGAPTVTGADFELAIGRDTLPDGVHPLFVGSTLRVAIVDTASGDQVPESGQVISYTLDVGAPPTDSARQLERAEPSDLRVVTYNVLNDAPWSPGLQASFGRQLAAVSPDIVNFQEIYSHSAAETAALVSAWVPAGAGRTWHAVGNGDCKTVCRDPILASWPLDGNLATLVDTTSGLDRELLIINAHLPCCTNDTGRQAEIDRIMAFLRDAREPGGAVTVPEGTAVLITGDLNLVGLVQQLESLLTGDIVNEGVFGSDFAPDWDGTGLANLLSRQTEKRMAYTWRNDGSSFWPGQLDYHIYTDSVLTVGNHFILFTPEMSSVNLANAGLVANDSQASDHLLFSVDFRPRPATPGDGDGDGDVDADDYARFAPCFVGPETVPPLDPDECLEVFDFDADADVDLSDFAQFAMLLAGV